jgi:hypothetical protein
MTDGGETVFPLARPEQQHPDAAEARLHCRVGVHERHGDEGPTGEVEVLPLLGLERRDRVRGHGETQDDGQNVGMAG